MGVLEKAWTSAALAFMATTLLAPLPARATDRWFSVQGQPDFIDVKSQLQVVVDEHARQATNRFCVVGESVGSYKEAWVYWPSDHKLILWRPDRDNPHAIAGSNRYLDLDHDVEKNDVGGSTYKLTRATADQKIQACARRGDNYTIEKRPGKDSHG